MDDERRPSAPQRPLGKVIKGPAIDEIPDRLAPMRPRPGVLNAEEYEARTTARRIIEDAEARAREIIQGAEAERDQVFAQARADAKAEVVAEASADIARAKMQAGQVLAAAQNDILELACQVAERIIGKDLEREPDVIVNIVGTAIESLRRTKSMVIKVNPRDGAVLREKVPKLMELVGKNMDLTIKDDRDVEPGGCVLKTEFGTVDAQLRTQFEMLKLVLLPDSGARKDLK